MLKLVLPLVLALAGTGAGVGAAMFLSKPDAQEQKSDQEHTCPEPPEEYASHASDKVDEEIEMTNREYVKLSNQFVVPIVSKDRISALIVMGLSLEVKAGATETVYSREPKLRDSFLQVMFDHANAGGFEGTFTRSSSMDILRKELRRVAQTVVGETALDVLITEIARQDAI